MRMLDLNLQGFKRKYLNICIIGAKRGEKATEIARKNTSEEGTGSKGSGKEERSKEVFFLEI